jgi:hypothetical protein
MIVNKKIVLREMQRKKEIRLPLLMGQKGRVVHERAQSTKANEKIAGQFF